MSRELDIDLVATNDVHYTYAEDEKPHDILLCIQTGKKLEDENRMRYEGGQYYVKSPEEMAQLFPYALEALDNTQRIADRCEVEIEFGVTKLPKYDVPDGMTSWEYLNKLCYEGLEKHYGNPSSELKDRLKYELDIIQIPEERRAQGILANLSVRENISVSALKELGGKFGLSKTKEQNLADKVIDDYDIKTPDIEKEIKFLSGGNQQKAIIGRSMSAKPRILIFDEPTKGIDIGTKTEIYRLMKKLAQQGIGIILISSELDEIKKCANRIICMHQGRVTGEFWAGTDKEAVLSSILGLDSKTEGEEVNE